MGYETRISRDSEGRFTAAVMYDGRMCPGLPMRHYRSRAAAERGASKMLAKAKA